MNHTYFFRGTPHVVIPGSCIAHVVWDRTHHHVCPTQPYAALTYTEVDSSQDWDQTRAILEAVQGVNRKNAASLGGFALYQERTSNNAVTSTLLVPIGLESALKKIVSKSCSLEPQALQYPNPISATLPLYGGNTPANYSGGGPEWELRAKSRWG